ncbi:ubiquitin-conjugating enzyme E2 S [Cichlidogyrus casuarinus]|uniref:E2 ubiquitin-conjugating enzyme n=1 Tax=Cichlidogyrus casuarinus TaxID=1844966 RepID=A0ABD2QJM4_9PLAT
MENCYPTTSSLKIAKELKEVFDSNIEGITLLCNEVNITELLAIIDGPKDTPFENGKFKIKLIFPPSYPFDPPKGYFLTKIFHPNVAPGSGEICVDTLKKDWQSTFGVKHILLTIRCLLIEPNPASALNEEAGKLLLEQYEQYCDQARIFTEVHASDHLKAKLSQSNKNKIAAHDSM